VADGDTTVLVVDDEPAIVRILRGGLAARGYRDITAATGSEALHETAVGQPDVIVLDLALPDSDGVDVCRRIREWSDVPIIVLSSDATERRKIAALGEGADDYVAKPFSLPELAARNRGALRHRPTAAVVDQPVLTVGDLTVDVDRHVVRVGDREVDLTPKEFAFLALLARWPGRVLTHRTILTEVWGPEYGDETQYLRVYATQLRKKLADPDRQRLVTEPGVGYRLIDPSEDD
jgi:two-component system KDP operon response regulator KdpE